MTLSLHQRGVVMPSHITHTHKYQDTPLSLSLDFQQLLPFYSLSQLHPSILLVITTRAREGRKNTVSVKQKWPHETHSVTYVPGRSTLSIFRALSRSSTVIPLLPKATFTRSIQHNIGLLTEVRLGNLDSI